MEQTMSFRGIVEDIIRKLGEATEPGQTLGTTRADVRLIGQQYQEAKVGKFTLACDEPLPVGGTDRGATPLEFFTAAIGVCENAMVTRPSPLRHLPVGSSATRVRGHW